MGKNIKIEDGKVRKRGRPAGKKRTPLSKAERLARNALYERERREEIANGMTDLADAIGCGRDMQISDLLAAAVQFIQSYTARTDQMADDVDSLRTQNQNLKERIRYLAQEASSQPNLPSPLLRPQDYHTMGIDFVVEQSSESSARTRGYMRHPRPKISVVPLSQLCS